MRLTIFVSVLVAAVAAVPAPQESEQAAEKPSSSAKSQADKIPVNLGASLKRPNGDVIGILKSRQEDSGAGLHDLPLDTDSTTETIDGLKLD